MSAIRWQDEILQMMYWMRGEKVAQEVAPEQLNRFLKIEPAQLDAAIQALIDAGCVVEHDGRFRLTARGIDEGKRRFLDEFSDVLGKESHVECSSPDCGCHEPGFSGICQNA